MKPLSLSSLGAAALCGLAAPAAAQFSPASSVPGWTPRAPTTPTASVPAQPGGGWTVFNYLIDDGTSENGLGLAGGGNFVFLQRFNATKGADEITSISVAWGTPTKLGSSPAAGTSVTVYLWDDPNDDGNPVDGVLVRQRTVSLQNPETDIKQKIDITPTVVKGTFFVGAKVNHAKGQFPGPLDYSKNSNGRSWVTGSLGGYSGNPVTGGVGLFELSAMPHQGVWLLGSEGVGFVSVTYCTAKTNSLGCTAGRSRLDGRRRASSTGHPGLPRCAAVQVRNQTESGLLVLHGERGATRRPWRSSAGRCASVRAASSRTPARSRRAGNAVAGQRLLGRLRPRHERVRERHGRGQPRPGPEQRGRDGALPVVGARPGLPPALQHDPLRRVGVRRPVARTVSWALLSRGAPRDGAVRPSSCRSGALGFSVTDTLRAGLPG